MLSKNKKTIIMILLLTISFFSISREIPKTESIDPFFSLVARYTDVTQSEYLNLIKQQLERIGIHLTLEYFNTSLMFTLCESQFFDLLH